MSVIVEVGTPSPTDLADGIVQSFTASANEVRSFALGALPANFDPTSVTFIQPNMSSRRNAAGDDTITLDVRIMSGSTVLGAGDAAGTFTSIASLTTNTGTFQASATGLNYINLTASEALWDAAVVEVRQNYSNLMSNDADFAEIDRLWVRVQYEPIPDATAPTLVSPPDLATVEPGVFDWTYNGVGAQVDFAFRRDVLTPFSTASQDAYDAVQYHTGASEANQIAFSPDGTMMARMQRVSGARLQVFDTSDWSLIIEIAHDATGGIAWSPDSSRLYTTDATGLLIYNTTTWTTIAHTVADTGTTYAFTISPTGRYIAAAHANPAPYMTIIDLDTGVLRTPTSSRTGIAYGWTPDEAYLIYAEDSDINTNGFWLLSTSTWTKVRSIGGATLDSTLRGSCDVSPDGTMVAYASWEFTNDGQSGVLDFATGDPVPGAPVLGAGNMARFSPDGQYLVFALGSESLVYRVSDWTLVRSNAGYGDANWIDWRPDSGAYGVSATQQYWLYVFEAGVTSTWWDGATFAPDETWITSPTTEVTIPASNFDIDATYDWAVACRSSDAVAGPYAEPFTFTATAPASNNRSGTIASALPTFSTAVAGTADPPTSTGTATSALPTFTTAMVGRVVDTGTAASTLPTFSTATAGTYAAPSDPGNLQATMAGVDVALTWNAPTLAGATHVDIHRRSGTSTTPFDPANHSTRLARIAAATTTYTDVNPGDGDWTYQVFSLVQGA